MTQCALKVSGMSCGGCAEAVQQRLLKLDGVKAATANHKTGEVQVEYDPKKTSPEKIVSAFNEGNSGFKAEWVKPKTKRD
ncbi:MAG: cation transporter [Firmicutes bacterium]|nr:cation transporter [Bacillota bacterium]